MNGSIYSAKIFHMLYILFQYILNRDEEKREKNIQMFSVTEAAAAQECNNELE